MPKLTETTKDQLRAAKSDGGIPVSQPHIIAAHEPLPNEPLTPPHPPLPNFPLPAKDKRGRKPKEQKVSLAPLGPQPQPVKIAVVGTAPSSRMLAPVNDPSWRIWVCSPGNMNIYPRIDAWFEVHGTVLLEPEEQHYAPAYIQYMSNLKCPVFMQDQQVIPHAISIPKDDLVREFGPYFFTSSFSWMIAMAIKTIESNGNPPGSEIKLFGIDMASREEYIVQRPGAYHFFQEAARRGIKVDAPSESDIMQPPPLYGYSDVTPYGRKLRARKLEIQSRVTQGEQQERQLHETNTYLRGAGEDIDYQLCIQGGAQDNQSHRAYLDTLIKQARLSVPEPVRVSVTSNSQG